MAVPGNIPFVCKNPYAARLRLGHESGLGIVLGAAISGEAYVARAFVASLLMKAVSAARSHPAG